VIIVYTPEAGPEERYDARDLRTSEAARVAQTIGQRWAQVKAALTEDDPEAMRAVVWAFKARETPGLRFGSFDPGVDDMVTRWDHREASQLVADAYKTQETEEGEREAFFRILVRNSADPADTEALIKELADGGPKEPTEPSPTSQSSD